MFVLERFHSSSYTLTHQSTKGVVVNDVTSIINVSLTAGTLVSSADALLNALVAESMAARGDRWLVHGGHAYGALEMLVHGGNLTRPRIYERWASNRVTCNLMAVVADIIAYGYSQR